MARCLSSDTDSCGGSKPTAENQTTFNMLDHVFTAQMCCDHNDKYIFFCWIQLNFYFMTTFYKTFFFCTLHKLVLPSQKCFLNRKITYFSWPIGFFQQHFYTCSKICFCLLLNRGSKLRVNYRWTGLYLTGINSLAQGNFSRRNTSQHKVLSAHI